MPNFVQVTARDAVLKTEMGKGMEISYGRLAQLLASNAARAKL